MILFYTQRVSFNYCCSRIFLVDDQFLKQNLNLKNSCMPWVGGLISGDTKEKVFRPCRCLHLSSGHQNYIEKQPTNPLCQLMRLIVWIDT